MKLLYCPIFCCIAVLTQAWYAESFCEHIEKYSGVISHNSRGKIYKCWYIDPWEESVIHIKILRIYLNDNYCDAASVELSDNYGRTEKLCQYKDKYPDRTNTTITFIGTVNITFYMNYISDSASILMEYDTESIICLSKDYFRCSSWQCITSKQVCDGIEDCENGTDEMNCGILETNETRISRKNAVNWLKRRHTNFGWGKNTHRAVTVLYLTDAAKYRGNSEEENFVKQLQLKTAASLLRNLTAPMSANELSMYVNALLVTCHNVRNIFSEDLLKILADRALTSSLASPGVYLTLCNANWPLSEKNVYPLLNLLTKDIDYPFALENRAMTIMALSCMRQKYFPIRNMYNFSSVYNKTINSFMLSQKKDGSFGNAHTTAMVTQALISDSRVESRKWNPKKALEFLMKSLNSSSVDFLSIYLTLPLFKEKTLVDIGGVDCSNYERKLEEDEDMLDVMDKLSSKIHVQYSLYIGNNKNIIHNIYLKVPDNSTALDVMKVAQIADPKYRFSYHKTTNHTYIYEVAGLSNDMEAGKFWFFYITFNRNSTLEHVNKSPDQIIMEDKEHLVLWYKSANF